MIKVGLREAGKHRLARRYLDTIAGIGNDCDLARIREEIHRAQQKLVVAVHDPSGKGNVHIYS